MRKTIVIMMALLLATSVVAWNSNPTYNPFEVIWNAINGMDSTPDTIADDNIISATEVDQSQIQLRVVGNCAVGSSIRAISPDGSVTCEPDDTGITSETDPQVASTTSGKWCRGTGTQVTCDQNAPVTGSLSWSDSPGLVSTNDNVNIDGDLDVTGTMTGDGAGITNLKYVGECSSTRKSLSLSAGNSDWVYVNCPEGNAAISCGSYVAHSDVITLMAGYVPNDVGTISPVPSKCLVAWRNDGSLTETVYAYATCCPR